MKSGYSEETTKLLEQLDHFISEASVLEKSVGEWRELLREVIEVQPTALWVLDSDGSIFLSNEKARSTPIDPLRIYPKQHDTELEVNGRFFILQVSKQGNKTIITATDNTNNRRNERLIAMGQVAAHIAHEIRNPIGAVSLLASTLYDRVGIGVKATVLEIKKSIWRVERIIKATLTFSSGFTLNPRMFHLNELVGELESAISNYSYTKPIEFSFDLPDKPIEADFELLGIALQNMLFNAIDAIEEAENEEDGYVNISYAYADNEDRIEVCDNGNPFEDPSRIFEGFYTTKTKGHGLGMILSRQIVEAHNGDITLLDGRKGFLITLRR
jgi:two-component system NtrC family sensor kinase/two-component system sensor histidine kinase AtoS